MAYEYRVTGAEDGTFPVELWSSQGGREHLIYKTAGFQNLEFGGVLGLSRRRFDLLTN